MANIIFREDQSIQQRLLVMQQSAAFDIADGDDYSQGNYFQGNMLNTSPAQIPNIDFNGIKAKTSPPKVPKLFLSNDCAFNCQYCGCRNERDKQRYVTPPEEMAEIAVKTAKNGRGVFITSAVYKNADLTEELILQTLKLIRGKHGYGGYVHAKIMPGADPLLIRQAGFLADRISVNIELPHSNGYKTIARQKNKNNILKPMNQIRDYINEYNSCKGGSHYQAGRKFAPAGQTTQMMVGTMGEDDRTIAVLAEALYKKYDMRRVYYSPFSPAKECDCLPDRRTPLWRARRMYQADRLMELYGMKADELLPESAPNLDFDIDPKASFALRNRSIYPIEVNTADYEMLLRVPGIGVVSAQKIIKARKSVTLTHEALRKIGVPIKKSTFFITCAGKYNGAKMLDSLYLRNLLRADEFVKMGGMEQMSFADYFSGMM